MRVQMTLLPKIDERRMRAREAQRLGADVRILATRSLADIIGESGAAAQLP